MDPYEAPDRALWEGEIQNWMQHEDVEHVPPPGNNRHSVKLTRQLGWGGLSLVWQEARGEAVVYVELADDGMHVRIYVPDTWGGEPALNARLFRDGIKVETIHNAKEAPEHA